MAKKKNVAGDFAAEGQAGPTPQTGGGDDHARGRSRSLRAALDSLAGEDSGGGSVGGGGTDARASHEVASHHVTPFELGSHPAREEVSGLGREIALTGPSHFDRAVFCRQLATMIEVGIPLLPALKMLSRRSAHPKLAAAIGKVANGVERGQSLSDAMNEQQRIFSPLVCNTVRVGEAGGILEDSLARLAQIMEARAEMSRKVFSSLMYPFVAIAVAVGVIILILMKAVPVFAGVYGDMGRALPRPTRLIIGMSNLLTKGFWIWLPVLVIGIVVLIVLARTPRGVVFRSFAAMHLPIFSRITRKIAVSRFTRTMSGLLEAGVPLMECVSIAADTSENTVVAAELRKVRESLGRGEKMSRPLARAGIFPPLVVDMIGIGEETGTLDRMLEKIANIYDADVDATLRGLSTIIEPLLIVLLGSVVILIALAVMLPYFSLVSVV